MKALLQRVTKAVVRVDQAIVGEAGRGLVIFLGVEEGDSEKDAEYLRDKCVNLRIFPNEAGKFDLSALDSRADLLVVSQFTLAAEWRKGNRPGFSRAAPPEEAERLYAIFCEKLRDAGLEVATGRFAAMMQVSLVGDGPFTLWMDTAAGA
ncbi:MAG: D-tyrosyl-tRNA(Tyr) deacylase [Chloroflexi bacterium]|nr:D-tyrosyl-tRNA(Tyr) deacylase [Chloroflexota bacterium]